MVTRAKLAAGAEVLIMRADGGTFATALKNESAPVTEKHAANLV